MEDNSTSADPLSYTTNGSRVDLELRGNRLLPLNVRTPTPQLRVELRIIKIDRETGNQFKIYTWPLQEQLGWDYLLPLSPSSLVQRWPVVELLLSTPYIFEQQEHEIPPVFVNFPSFSSSSLPVWRAPCVLGLASWTCPVSLYLYEADSDFITFSQHETRWRRYKLGRFFAEYPYIVHDHGCTDWNRYFKYGP